MRGSYAPFWVAIHARRFALQSLAGGQHSCRTHPQRISISIRLASIWRVRPTGSVVPIESHSGIDLRRLARHLTDRQHFFAGPAADWRRAELPANARVRRCGGDGQLPLETEFLGAGGRFLPILGYERGSVAISITAKQLQRAPTESRNSSFGNGCVTARRLLGVSNSRRELKCHFCAKSLGTFHDKLAIDGVEPLFHSH